jgi:hypothetical protein
LYFVYRALSRFAVLGWTAAALGFSTPAYAVSIIGDGWEGAGSGPIQIGYHIVGSGTPDLPNENVLVELALSKWAQHAPIHFTETGQSGADNSIDFYFAFELDAPHFVQSDGPWGDVGYAFFPDDLNPEPLAGDIFFDEAETWLGGTTAPGVCTASGCQLFFVAMHEIGHALGLVHSSDSQNDPASNPSVMSPFFTPTSGPHPGFGAFSELQAADIEKLQLLYGSGSGSVNPLQALPEPGSGLLLGLGLAGVAWVRRRRGA